MAPPPEMPLPTLPSDRSEFPGYLDTVLSANSQDYPKWGASGSVNTHLRDRHPTKTRHKRGAVRRPCAAKLVAASGVEERLECVGARRLR